MSGIGRYLRTILHSILDNIENQYILLGNSDELKSYRLYDNVEIIELGNKIYSPLEHIELKRKIPVCDIFFSPHFITPFFNLPAKKRITTVHDTFHLSDMADFGILKKAYLKFLYRNAIVKSDLILTVSHATERSLASIFPKSIGKIKVIYNSVDLDILNKSSETSPESVEYALFVGNIKPHKNLLRLVNVFKRMNNNDFKLVIVGDKENFINGITDFDKILIDQDNIIFTGKVSDEKLVSYYSNAEFLIFPSLFEGFGYPPLEAMLCGTPVVSSSIEVIKEICGEAVYYFNPFDENDMFEKITNFIESKDLREKYILRGSDKVKKYNPTSFAREYQSLFGLSTIENVK